ncbi:carbamoyl phosphate synthetase [Mucilaginibacter sp. PAMC 26640]|nr:carbamoyl phosphate synthetase [Mucilaginibacter sp. PAMC 26640]
MKTTLFKSAKYRAVAAVRMISASITLILISLQAAMAQDGNAGINQATSQVKSYFDTGTNLMYAIGAIVGLVGAIKVFKKWNDGEHDTSKVASSWFGSCIFLVVVATVLKSFFGV